MNDEEFRSFNFLKLKYRRGDKINQPFCRIGSLSTNQVFLFNFKKFSKHEKNFAESCRIQSNLMNDEGFRSFNFLKLKYRRGDK